MKSGDRSLMTVGLLCVPPTPEQTEGRMANLMITV
jgi:hypothetical protein